MRSYRDFKIYSPAILVFLAVISFSVYSFYQLKKSAKARRAKLFEISTRQAADQLQKRIVDYTQILRGCQSLFYSSDSVDSKEWYLYTSNLQLSANYPGIQGVAFAKYISRDESENLEKQIRREDPKFKIRSDVEDSHLTPIIYIEPRDERNLRAYGFDMFSESNRRQAMTRALLTGLPAMSKKVTLVQETNVAVQPGFLLYLPVYRNQHTILTEEERQRNIQGFVYIPFRAYDLMNAVFLGFENMEIEVYDQDTVSEENLLYRLPVDKGGERLKESKIEFRVDTVLNIAGNKWTLHFATDSRFGSQVERSQPQLVLIFGAAISVLLYLLTVNYINKRQMALEELNFAKEIERKKDEFIGIASHELKTPLTSVKAYLQMLARSSLGEKEKNFVHKANVQTNKLSSLIADLLDVSKIQAGSIKFNKAPFTLAELINESAESVHHMYPSHEVQKPSLMPDITLHGDKLRLEQALINLLVNGIKYSPGASQVRLDVKTGVDEIMISVSDEGIGISKDNQTRIFEKFYRAEELSPVFSGLGMGLFIAFEIVRRHKGTITVESELGKGATFSIHLPLGNEA